MLLKQSSNMVNHNAAEKKNIVSYAIIPLL